MKRLQAWKFELKPNGAQQRQMRRFAGSCRVVFKIETARILAQGGRKVIDERRQNT